MSINRFKALAEKPSPGSREAAMVVLEHDASGTPTVWCDPEIADIVAALNNAGLRTVASCSGHGERLGWIALKDGRQLAIAPTLLAFQKWQIAPAEAGAGECR